MVLRQAHPVARQDAGRGIGVDPLFLGDLVQGRGKDFPHPFQRHDADAVVVAENQIARLDRATGAGNGAVDDAAEPLVRPGRNRGAGEAGKAELADLGDVAH
ncbi:MAG: hypothetical protein O7I42_20980, partial [Alphaproteobacteria bacterium]|nr:hypothetical protein [Alphaproteobacteria bacterium]